MQAAYHCYAISDHSWESLESHYSGRKGTWGGIAANNRLSRLRYPHDFESIRSAKHASSDTVESKSESAVGA